MPDQELVIPRRTLQFEVPSPALARKLANTHLVPSRAAEAAGYGMSPDSLSMVERVVRWQDHSPVLRVSGRNFFISDEKGDLSYDTIQIGGIGYAPFILYVSGANVAIADPSIPIRPPATSNILEAFPSLHSFIRVLHSGYLDNVRARYRYTGGYTQQEVHEKSNAMELVLGWDDKPFLAPIPLGFGFYRKLSGDAGKVFFVISRVPFQGLRFGDFLSLYSQGLLDAEFIESNLTDTLKGLGATLRYFHDKGYVHCQPHLGNCLSFEDKFFLADFSTLSRIHHNGARAFDLYIAIKSAVGALTVIFNGRFDLLTPTNTLGYIAIDAGVEQLFNEVVSSLFAGYTGREQYLSIDPMLAYRIMNLPAVEYNSPGPSVGGVYLILKELGIID